MIESKCYIQAELKNGRTVLKDTYYTAPFKIMRPFMQGSRSKVIVMTASAGILAGDRYDLKYEVGEGADLVITGQGYTKIFNTESSYSKQCLRAEVAKNGRMAYLPYPAIPFTGSDYRSHICASLNKESTFICSDIVACGRSMSGERFGMKRFHSRMEVYVAEELVFLDNCMLQPEKINYASMGFFDTYSHMGTLYIYIPGDTTALIEEIRALPFTGRRGTSMARKGVIVRALADSGDEIHDFFMRISEFV